MHSATPDRPRDPHRVHVERPALVRAVWVSLGLCCVGVGAVGVVLPGLPTTPFLILAAACFVRSSQRLYDRLTTHRVVGPPIRAFREGRGVPRRARRLALGLMGVFVLFALGPGLPEGRIGLRVVVAVTALVGALYLLHLPTYVGSADAASEEPEPPDER